MNYMQGFGIESFISFVLVMVVFGAADDENNIVNAKVAKKTVKYQKYQIL